MRKTESKKINRQNLKKPQIRHFLHMIELFGRQITKQPVQFSNWLALVSKI